MIRPDKFPLAAPGWPYVLGGLVLALAASALGVWWMAIPLWLILILMINFFRDPARAGSAGPRAVLSPADGKVVVIEEVEGEADLPPGKWRLVSIFMNIFDVHVNRAPAAGTVLKLEHFAGGFVPADRDEARTGNERLALHLKAESGAEMVVMQVAGLVARRIHCHAAAGDRLARSQRYGMIRFGSRLDVYLPADAKVAVSLGQKVRAGESVIGEL